jgi:hypothetical protein
MPAYERVSRAPRPLLRFRVDHREESRRYEAQQRRQRAQQLHQLYSDPLAVIAQESNLHDAFNHCRLEGGQGPGPNGLGYDFYKPRKWDLLRELATAILGGTYEPGPEVRTHIPKPNGTLRPLVLENIPARVVHRAIAQALAPAIDPQMRGLSFGGRGGYSPQHAMALAEYLIGELRASIVICEDLVSAFDFVRPAAALNLLPPQLSSHEELIGLLSRVLESRMTCGLRQGAATSTSMLNLYLDRTLDMAWARRHPNVPLLRYIDDLLLIIPAELTAQAHQIYADLRSLVESAGMRLKGTEQSSTFDLGRRQPINWLGFCFRLGRDGRLDYSIPRNRQSLLLESLENCHFEDSPQLRADHVLVATIKQLGPVYEQNRASRFLSSILSAAAHAGFHELTSANTLGELWAQQHLRWQQLRHGAGHWFARRRMPNSYTLRPCPSPLADGNWRICRQ